MKLEIGIKIFSVIPFKASAQATNPPPRWSSAPPFSKGERGRAPLSPTPSLKKGERERALLSPDSPLKKESRGKVFLSTAPLRKKGGASALIISRRAGGFLPKGFTLLELLIVIFIIAIIISVATLALGDMGKNRKAGYFAEQLKSTLAYAQQYAVIQPTTVIFELDNNHYQFKSLQMIAHDNGNITYRWKPLNNPGSRDDNAPDYVTLQMKSKDTHSIQINSSGTMTPFSMHIGVLGENSYYLLNGNAAGVLTLTKQSVDNS